MKRFVTLGFVALLLPAPVLGKVEGTAQLGATQGLDSRAVLRIQIEEAGEVIRICSSDDGKQEPETPEGPVDREPGADNQVRSERLGNEIVLFPPEAAPCEGQAFCPPGLRCFDRIREVPYDSLPANERSSNAQCGIALVVQNTASNLGYCSATDEDVNWHEVVANVSGVWEVDFAGEPETLGSGGLSTRYFGIDVAHTDGSSVNGGRVHAVQWLLNGHQVNSPSAGEFFVRRPVGDGFAIFVLDFEALDGLRYTVVANDEGLNGQPDRSWCQYGDPGATRECPQDGEAELQLLYAKYPIFLSFPDPQPEPAAEPSLSETSFNDAVGTRSISPNGDGVQDDGIFGFEANMNGVYRIYIDTNGDGVFSQLDDLVLRGDARPGLNEVSWDGRDAAGTPLAPGTYGVQMSLYAGETHFPLADVEENAEGLLIWRQEAAGLETRRPTPMFWNDIAVLNLEQASSPLSSLPEGAFNQARSWTQPESNRPIIFDTWVFSTVSRTTTFSCRRCQDDVEEVIIGDDESADSDEDGIPDDQEDLNGDGILDVGETDPNNPDTDGDGLSDGDEALGDTDATRADTDGDRLDDGQEDRNLDGLVGGDETDPTNPDTDGDSLVDGAEDRNGNGTVDVDETDPLNPDTDGDGIGDAFDPAPRDPEPPTPPETTFNFDDEAETGGTGGADAIADGSDTTGGAMGGTTGFGQIEDLGDITTRVSPEEVVGCDCRAGSHQSQSDLFVLALGFGIIGLLRRRVRVRVRRGNDQTL